MQPGSCEEIGLLISRYADGEATPDEIERVERHTATCDECSCKLLEYRSMAAIFSEAPARRPDADLEVRVFAEIARQKDEVRRRELLLEREREREKTQQTAAPRRRWAWPFWGARRGATPGLSPFAMRFLNAASPFAAGGVALFALLFALALNGKIGLEPAPDKPSPTAEAVVPVVPTIPPTIAISQASDLEGDGSTVPGAVMTRVPDLGAPSPTLVSVSRVPRSTVTLGNSQLINLRSLAPVLEDGDLAKTSTWHVMRDPAYGYNAYYPPNWWTYVQGDTRYFYPWQQGGEQNSAYWVDLRVADNPDHLTAEAASHSMFGSCKLYTSGALTWVRPAMTVDAKNKYDMLYAFDQAHIYTIRLTVPQANAARSFEDRWSEAESVFTRMSARVQLPLRVQTGGYAPVVFLNGTDLFTVGADGTNPRALTRGYNVRDFALGPDLRHIAFLSVTRPPRKGEIDPWPGALYLMSLDDTTDDTGPKVWWSGVGSQDNLEIHDLAWYSDRELLVIARSDKLGFGIFRLKVGANGAASTSDNGLELVQSLGDDMLGARGLSVSPDRQLITFLSPLGENKGTDIYALRPDGTDLIKLVSHSDPVSPSANGQPVFSSEGQAVKSYSWVDGRLEGAGYLFNMLFTCGDAQSPTEYRGGFLYSAPTLDQGTLLRPDLLGVQDADQVRITGIAYSPSGSGRVAVSGFYNLRDTRVEVLAGLWVADMAGGSLSNLRRLPAPDNPNGIADLEWSPDGTGIIYRETTSADTAALISRYNGLVAGSFRIIREDATTGARTTLYESGR